MILWLAAMSRRAARRSGTRALAAIPAGYRCSAVGAAVFGLGGLADMVWHLIFGVELGIDALMSPSHLLLFVGGVLLLSGPVLAVRGRGTRTLPARITALVSVVSITGVAAFALSLLSAFITDAPTMTVSYESEGTEAHFVSDSLASAGLGSFIVTSLVLVVPAVFMLRVKVGVPGSLTVLITAVAVMASALTGFESPERVVAAFAAAAILDMVVGVLRPRMSERTLELLVAFALALLVWTLQLVAVAVVSGLGWSVAMSSGVVLMSALVSVVTTLTLGLVASVAAPMPWEKSVEPSSVMESTRRPVAPS